MLPRRGSGLDINTKEIDQLKASTYLLDKRCQNIRSSRLLLFELSLELWGLYQVLH